MEALNIVTERIGSIKEMIISLEGKVETARNVYDVRKIRLSVTNLEVLLEVNETIYMNIKGFH